MSEWHEIPPNVVAGLTAQSGLTAAALASASKLYRSLECGDDGDPADFFPDEAVQRGDMLFLLGATMGVLATAWKVPLPDIVSAAFGVAEDLERERAAGSS